MSESAKTAFVALRDSDHPLGRPLALCLMFEGAKDQWLAASVFDLAIALDAALHIPSESLLAAIRVQWWADALASDHAQTAPLVTQLQALFDTHDGLQAQTIDLISHWQTACHNENRDSGEGWNAAWSLVAAHLGYANNITIAQDIGHQLHHLVRGQAAHGAQISPRSAIAALRRDDAGNKRSWLYLTACLLRYMQRRPHADFGNPALVWHIVAWYIFGPPR